MRDPARIDRIINELKELWKVVPDWRLGQLMANLKRSGGWEDLFYIEDDKIEELIKAYYDYYKQFEVGE